MEDRSKASNMDGSNASKGSNASNRGFLMKAADDTAGVAPSQIQAADKDSRKHKLDNLQKFIGGHTSRKLVVVWNFLEVRVCSCSRN
jgi:hypothetical protein